MNYSVEREKKINQAIERLCKENKLSEKELLEIMQNISDIKVRAQLMTQQEIEQLKSSIGKDNQKMLEQLTNSIK